MHYSLVQEIMARIHQFPEPEPVSRQGQGGDSHRRSGAIAS